MVSCTRAEDVVAVAFYVRFCISNLIVYPNGLPYLTRENMINASPYQKLLIKTPPVKISVNAIERAHSNQDTTEIASSCDVGHVCCQPCKVDL